MYIALLFKTARNKVTDYFSNFCFNRTLSEVQITTWILVVFIQTFQIILDNMMSEGTLVFFP